MKDIRLLSEHHFDNARSGCAMFYCPFANLVYILKKTHDDVDSLHTYPGKEIARLQNDLSTCIVAFQFTIVLGNAKGDVTFIKTNTQLPKKLDSDVSFINFSVFDTAVKRMFVVNTNNVIAISESNQMALVNEFNGLISSYNGGLHTDIRCFIQLKTSNMYVATASNKLQLWCFEYGMQLLSNFEMVKPVLAITLDASNDTWVRCVLSNGNFQIVKVNLLDYTFKKETQDRYVNNISYAGFFKDIDGSLKVLTYQNPILTVSDQYNRTVNNRFLFIDDEVQLTENCRNTFFVAYLKKNTYTVQQFDLQEICYDSSDDDSSIIFGYTAVEKEVARADVPVSFLSMNKIDYTKSAWRVLVDDWEIMFTLKSAGVYNAIRREQYTKLFKGKKDELFKVCHEKFEVNNDVTLDNVLSVSRDDELYGFCLFDFGTSVKKSMLVLKVYYICASRTSFKGTGAFMLAILSKFLYAQLEYPDEVKCEFHIMNPVADATAFYEKLGFVSVERTNYMSMTLSISDDKSKRGVHFKPLDDIRGTKRLRSASLKLLIV